MIAGPILIAGVDEAGRGCLAGPVVAAAVVLPVLYDLPHLGDSKTLSAMRRAALAPAIRACATAWGLGVVWPRDIERINILQATFLAMARAVRVLRVQPALLRIDGNATIPHSVLSTCMRRTGMNPLIQQEKKSLTVANSTACTNTRSAIRQEALVRGDAREPCIAAASILAKTFRDTLMLSLHKRWPVYGFDRHKGYATEEHRKAVRAHGPCPQHRITFAGVREVFTATGASRPFSQLRDVLYGLPPGLLDRG